jgi:hypothetical protein
MKTAQKLGFMAQPQIVLNWFEKKKWLWLLTKKRGNL